MSRPLVARPCHKGLSSRRPQNIVSGLDSLCVFLYLYLVYELSLFVERMKLVSIVLNSSMMFGSARAFAPRVPMISTSTAFPTRFHVMHLESAALIM